MPKLVYLTANTFQCVAFARGGSGGGGGGERARIRGTSAKSYWQCVTFSAVIFEFCFEWRRIDMSGVPPSGEGSLTGRQFLM